MSIYIKGKKNVFATEKRVRKITTLIYYKATVIEIVWYWHKKKKKWDKTENPETNPHTYDHTVYDKGSKNI